VNGNKSVWISSLDKYVPVFLMILLMAVLTISNRNFLSGQSIFNLLQQVSALGIVAFGAMIVLLTAGIDFTAGFGLSLAGVTAGYVYLESGNNGIVLILTALLVGAAIGFINGAIIVKLNLNPFITTLAMMSICKGVSMLVSEGRQVTITTNYLLSLGSGRILSCIPVSFVVFMIAVILMHIIMNKTKLGIYTYAMGGNEDAVVYSGINKGRYKILVYTAAGICYGLAAVITCAQVTVITSNISGDYLLDGIAAAVIGGTGLQGGKGTVFGVTIGAFIITLITTILNFLQVPYLFREVIKGLIIMGILLFDIVVSKTTARMRVTE